MNRRNMVLSLAGALATALSSRQSVAGSPTGSTSPTRPTGPNNSSPPEKKTNVGIADFSFQLRHATERNRPQTERHSDPINFLEHSRLLGAGGIQVNIPPGDETYATRLRRQAETYGMFIEGSGSLPRTESDVARFEAAVLAAKLAGASVIRIPIGGRRYEQFDNREGYRAFAERSEKSLELAAPVVARHRVRLAIENHKDFRVPEMLAMLKRIDSEYVGVCVDTGNSIALLEDLMEVVQAYAPWAYSAHLKDAAVCEYDDGFLLGDVPLGDGFVDLAGMVGVLRQAKAEIRFCLEVATRDPLKVPCLTEKYWATMAEVSGRDLARTLRTVRAHAQKAPDPPISRLPLEKQIQMEEENIKRSLAYARDQLKL